MGWKLFRWVWKLESPLHIGFSASGSLNRTRLYIPARTMWGAITDELARQSSENAFPEYSIVGQEISRNSRFSYLYPGEQVNGNWYAWLPCFEKGKGLVWIREDNQDKKEDREFRRRLLTTRPGTAINHNSNGAEEGTLREFELINPLWLNENNPFAQPVAMIGYVFAKDGYGLPDDLRNLTIGGESRYGLGKIKRIIFEEANKFFGFNVIPNGADPVVKANRCLAHAYDIRSKPNSTNVPKFNGDYEYLSGWDKSQNKISAFGLTLSPGTCWNCNETFEIHSLGLWQYIPSK